MVDAASQVIAVISCALILYKVEPKLNKMGRLTSHKVRIAVHQLLLGSVAELWLIAAHAHVPSLSELLLLVGIALWLECDRREHRVALLKRIKHN